MVDLAIPFGRPCNWTLMILLLRSVMIFLNTGFQISRLIKKKARNSGKSQLFAENFAQRFK